MGVKKNNPYDIDLPAVVSFSGGRTSGYLLRHILDAKGGQPDDLAICFQNTGLEHYETYEFVHKCEENWGVNVVWLEYCLDEDNKHATKIVDYETASRKGEPFTALIHKKQYLPNPVARICTANLKVRTAWRYLKELPGFQDGWTNCIGLRADEPRRVARLKSDSKLDEPYFPLYHAGVTQEDVDAWWEGQPFNLTLPGGGNGAGNCVGCFLKGGAKLENLMREMPEYFDWWREAERIPLKSKGGTGGKFRVDRPSYEDIFQLTRRQALLFDPNVEDDTIPCFCAD